MAGLRAEQMAENWAEQSVELKVVKSVQAMAVTSAALKVVSLADWLVHSEVATLVGKRAVG